MESYSFFFLVPKSLHHLSSHPSYIYNNWSFRHQWTNIDIIAPHSTISCNCCPTRVTSASFGNSKMASMSLTRSTDKGSVPVTCLTFRWISWPLKASGAMFSSRHPPFHCTLSNNAKSLVSFGTNSLGSCGLSCDMDLSLFPSLPLSGIVLELHAMAVTLFMIRLMKYNFMSFQNNLSYKTLRWGGYSTYNIIIVGLTKEKLQHEIADRVTVFA